MRSTKTALLAIAAATLMGVLPGCGSSRSVGDESSGASAGPFGVDAENRPYVGADQCIVCHEGEDAVADYLVGKHVLHSTAVDAAMGGDGCLACHDPIGDGRRLEGLIAAGDVPAAGLAAVTCEACHGAGGQHYGVGPIPTASPDYTVCGRCHNADFATTTAGHTDFTEARNILADYTASPHNWDMRNSAICVKCHTDEGGRLYKNITTWDALSATLPIDGETHPIQCRTCHNAHNSGELLKPATSSASAEYNTCTNCHQRHDAQLASDPGTDDGASGDLIYHAKRFRLVISSTHYDDPATGATKIEGYVMNPADERVCRNCHNVHAADITINNQWGWSGHGGKIMQAKVLASLGAIDNSFAQVLAVRAAYTDASWSQEVWADDAHAACQRCHTATGGQHFLDNSQTYQGDMAKFLTNTPAGSTSPNDFSYLKKDADVYAQQEMLFCWACHSDSTGALRSQANVSLIDLNNTIFATIPAQGNSTVCVGCHAGRANGSYIANQAPADRSSESLVHKLPAAAFLFSAQTHSGYEFAAMNYADKDYFVHKDIGLNDASPATGDGPCASCHMANADHSLQALGEEVDAEGQIVGIIKNQTLCDVCHGDDMKRTNLDAKKLGFEAAMLLLQGYVENTSPNYLGTNLSSVDTDLAGVPVEAYGAEQNYQFLGEDPGVYVHNSIYAKRLIFDAIDWLQDGDLDGVLNLTGQDAAYNYLLTYPAGTQPPPITALTRP